MGKVKLFGILAIAGLGIWLAYQYQDQITDSVGQYVENSDMMTLEARYSADQIMEAHKKELLTDSQKSYQNSELQFYPYALLEVKYTDKDHKPKEGVILWGLVDGEMVINTETWEKSHGFEDAINAHATRNDFKIINALAKNKGSLTHDQLLQELHLEADVVDPWVESTISKHLVVKKGAELKLHFQNPKIPGVPATKINQWLVTKPYNNVQKVGKKYSKGQIEKNAKAAFGSDFSIRNITEVFLPVYSIEVLNGDGSILTSYWNALSGQRINPKYLAEGH